MSASDPFVSLAPSASLTSDADLATDTTTQTRAELASHLAQRMGMPTAEALSLVHGFFDVITQELYQGREVSLMGFGRFHLRDKGERPARNPRTGEAVRITPRRVVTFQAGPQLKARLQRAHGAQPQSGAALNIDVPPEST